jgi:prepilin-type N-terminal cleavage/methylation domain-containing protein
MKKSTRGFTLVELAVVIGVIGILAAITIVAYNGAQGRARDARRETDIANIAKALELYYDDNGAYPDPNGTTSTINSSWYTSNDTSWDTFSTDFGSAYNPPKDPKNNANPLTTNGYSYAYFTGGYCGAANAQWYLIVYKLETMPKESRTDGDCSTNPLGDSYYTSGASYYRMVR